MSNHKPIFVLFDYKLNGGNGHLFMLLQVKDHVTEMYILTPIISNK